MTQGLRLGQRLDSCIQIADGAFLLFKLPVPNNRCFLEASLDSQPKERPTKHRRMRALRKRIGSAICQLNEFSDLRRADCELAMGIVWLELGHALRQGDVLKALEYPTWQTVLQVTGVDFDVVTVPMMRLDPDGDDELWQRHV